MELDEVRVVLLLFQAGELLEDAEDVIGREWNRHDLLDKIVTWRERYNAFVGE